MMSRHTSLWRVDRITKLVTCICHPNNSVIFQITTAYILFQNPSQWERVNCAKNKFKIIPLQHSGTLTPFLKKECLVLPVSREV